MKHFLGKFTPFFKDLVALAAGAILVLAFAPFNYFYLAILALALLLWTWTQATPGRAAWRGLLFGMGLFGCGISWVFISIHVYGNTPVWMAGVATGALVVILAIISVTFQGYVLRRFFSVDDANTLLLAFPTLWVLFEWLRGWLFTGLPWLFVGYSQTNSLLRYLAPIGSVYLVSFAVAFSAGAIVYALTNRKNALYSLAALLLVWCIAGALSNIRWTEKQSTPLRASLIQGDIPLNIKWNAKHASDTLATYKRLTESLQWHDHIIVWPEASIPMLLNDAQNYVNYFDAIAKKNNVAMIMGVPRHDNGRYFNSMIGIGSALGTYDKRHLVPFGEYVPLEKLLRGLFGFLDLPMSNFSAGAHHQYGISMFGFNVGSYICYEVAYPDEFLSQFPDAKLIITISDDAWFGDSFAPAQQLQISQMRSIETGRYQLVATNNGVTAIIDPYGKILKRLPQFETGVLTGTVYAMHGATPIIGLGIAPVIFVLFVLLFIAFAFRPETITKKRNLPH